MEAERSQTLSKRKIWQETKATKTKAVTVQTNKRIYNI
jgi:hypothetical protein